MSWGSTASWPCCVDRPPLQANNGAASRPQECSGVVVALFSGLAVFLRNGVLAEGVCQRKGSERGGDKKGKTKKTIGILHMHDILRSNIN